MDVDARRSYSPPAADRERKQHCGSVDKRQTTRRSHEGRGSSITKFRKRIPGGSSGELDQLVASNERLNHNTNIEAVDQEQQQLQEQRQKPGGVSTPKHNKYGEVN
jgi:hypothetical protein